MNLQLPEPPKARRAKRVLNVDRIPKTAWDYADRMRQRLLERDPGLALRHVKWDIETKTGQRAQWAEAFRIMADKDKRPWDEIGAVLKWLFTEDHMFTIQSPSSLIEKFDRVREAMRKAAKPAPPRPGADTRPTPKFTAWGSES